MEDSLQRRLRVWIDRLSKVKVLNLPLFQSPLLRFLCLVNENSLFYEDTARSRRLLLGRYLKRIQTEGFQSMQVFKSQVMGEVYRRFRDLLTVKGYRGILFLSNYQAAGADREINQACSKVLDRHFYLDYPQFVGGKARVHNRSPLQEVDVILKEIQAILPPEGGYISEFNLPWPNRYQHELIPLMLVLHKTRKIRGIWFYDYRLRNVDFHAGGLFGIQRFRSIIAQLPYLEQIWSGDYQIEKIRGGLRFLGKDLVGDSGWVGDGDDVFPGTLWRSPSKAEFFSFEKARGDRFNLLGEMQIHKGQQALELAPSASQIFQTMRY